MQSPHRSGSKARAAKTARRRSEMWYMEITDSQGNKVSNFVGSFIEVLQYLGTLYNEKVVYTNDTFTIRFHD
jgi:hypothetical protein